MEKTNDVLPFSGISRDVVARFYQKEGQAVSFYLVEKKLDNGEIRDVVLVKFTNKEEYVELLSGLAYKRERFEAPTPAAYLPKENGFVFFAPLTEQTHVSCHQLMSRYGSEVLI